MPWRTAHHLRRIEDFLRAFWLRQTSLARAERMSREELAALQERRLRGLVAYARERSPYYRERLAGIDPERFSLRELPILNKQLLMEHFDEIVTAEELNLPALEAQVQTMWVETYVRDKYRVLPTSGSSGFRSIVVYDRRAWRWVLAASLREAYMAGMRPRIPRPKVAFILAGNPAHLSFIVGSGTSVGATTSLRLSASVSFSSLIEPLNAFRPRMLVTYPTVASYLAQEQIEGRLRIGPRIVTLSAEVLTDEVRRRIVQAWGVEPFNTYAATEGGVMAADCERHSGMHCFEDLLLFEVVDEQYEPVAPGERGSKLVVTNLMNYAQPIIRYELNDILTMSPEPCACGRPFRVIERIAGRPQEVFYLEDASGRHVPVFPALTLGEPLILHPRVREFQMTQELDGLDINVVPRDGAQDLERDVSAAVTNSIQEAGLTPPAIRVHVLGELPRDPSKMDKLPMFKRNFDESALPRGPR